MDATDTAIQALLTANEALVKIGEHEKQCGERWASLRNVMLLVLGAVVSTLGVVSYELLMA